MEDRSEDVVEDHSNCPVWVYKNSAMKFGRRHTFKEMVSISMGCQTSFVELIGWSWFLLGKIMNCYDIPCYSLLCVDIGWGDRIVVRTKWLRYKWCSDELMFIPLAQPYLFMCACDDDHITLVLYRSSYTYARY